MTSREDSDNLSQNYPNLKLSSAYFLVSHGSRNPRPQLALQELGKLLGTRLALLRNNLNDGSGSRPLVGTGTLELAPTPLHQQLQEFAARAKVFGLKEIQVIPLFLLPGVHVIEDIPAEVAIASGNRNYCATVNSWVTAAMENPPVESQNRRKEARATRENNYCATVIAGEATPMGNAPVELENRGGEISFNLRPYLGSHQAIGDLLAAKIAADSAEVWILISHGSRRPGSERPIEKIADYLQRQCGVKVCIAFWSVPPNLESQILSLVDGGYRRIGVLPYFLFSGGITEALANSVGEFAKAFPWVDFSVAQPLGATPELVELILGLGLI